MSEPCFACHPSGVHICICHFGALVDCACGTGHAQDRAASLDVGSGRVEDRPVDHGGLGDQAGPGAQPDHPPDQEEGRPALDFPFPGENGKSDVMWGLPIQVSDQIPDGEFVLVSYGRINLETKHVAETHFVVVKGIGPWPTT